MTTTRLARHRLFATCDVDEARAEVARRFCPHRLTPTQAGSRVDVLHNAAEVGSDVSLHYLRYGAEVRITPGTFEDFFLVQIPLAGSARVKVGDTVVASDRHRASVGSPTEPVDMLWSQHCEQLLVYLRRQAVEQTAGASGSSDDPVVFAPMLDLDAPQVRSWLRLVHLGLDDLEAGGHLFASPLAATNFEQTVITGLLAAQANSHARQAPCAHAGSRVVRVATELIDAHPEEPWRVAELAERAGVSSRTLQEAFHRELGVTPLEHLRLVRLDRVRRDLLDADPTTTSVTDVAARWGFFHLGRFAQAYRSAFHELPSQTLAQ